MILAAVLLLSFLLTLGLLALLDRYDAAMVKALAARQSAKAREQVAYYDAFADRRRAPHGPRTDGAERRKAGA